MPEIAPNPDGDGHKREPPQEKLPLRRRMGRWRRAHPRGTVVIALLLVASVAAAIFLGRYLRSYISTDDAQIDAHIAPLSTRVSGTVTAVLVEDNQAVKAGQLLIQLDPRDYQVALERAQGDLLQAEGNLAAENPNLPMTMTTTNTQLATFASDVDNARAALSAAEREVQSAEARVHAARANLARADADLARYKFLSKEKAIPEERYDQVVATAKAQRADLQSQLASARAARHVVEEQRARLAQALKRQGEVQKNAPRQVSIRQAELDAREGAVKAAQAAVARARLDLEYTRIVAPFDGVVGKRTVEPGQRVQPGEQLMALVDLDRLWVTANFKETQIQRLKLGQPARISVDALDQKYDGWVESFAGASGARYSLLPPENATGNYVKVVQRLPVRIGIQPGQDSQHRLRPGMSVEPKVHVR
jgi:membrane fusion protein (multidrug efflux system)